MRPLFVLNAVLAASIGLVGCTHAKKGLAISPPALTPSPEMKNVLDTLASLNPKPIETLSPGEARKQPTPTDAVTRLKQKMGLPTDPPPTVKTAMRTVPGPQGNVAVRVYTPSQGETAKPVIVYAHGGGWVIATLDTYDAGPRALASLTGAIVLSVDYRQAPEHKFPAAHEDVYAVLEWASKNARDVGGDAKRIAVAGESAGGNMATAACLMAKDRGGQMPIHQLLIYPLTQVGTETPSYMANKDAKPLNVPMLKWFGDKYLNSPADAKNPYMSPLYASQLSGLPPATVITASIDPLQSEGEMYAEKLKKAGVAVVYKNYERVTHEFFGMADVVPEAKQAQQFAADRLNAAFRAR